MSRSFYRFCQICLFCFFKIWNRLSVVGAENLPCSGGGYILASNHVSYLDPPVMGAAIRSCISFLAKERLFRMPMLGTAIRWLGAVPVAGDSDFRTLRNIIRQIRENRVISIFPEGTRTDGGLDTMKLGVAFLGHMSGAPVVPCYIAGTDEALTKGQWFIRPSKITLYIGKPIYVPKSSGAKEEHYRRQVAAIARQIRELRPDSQLIREGNGNND